jgi:hypothetical protein
LGTGGGEATREGEGDASRTDRSALHPSRQVAPPPLLTASNSKHQTGLSNDSLSDSAGAGVAKPSRACVPLGPNLPICLFARQLGGRRVRAPHTRRRPLGLVHRVQTRYIRKQRKQTKTATLERAKKRIDRASILPPREQTKMPRRAVHDGANHDAFRATATTQYQILPPREQTSDTVNAPSTTARSTKQSSATCDDTVSNPAPREQTNETVNAPSRRRDPRSKQEAQHTTSNPAPAGTDQRCRGPRQRQRD